MNPVDLATLVNELHEVRADWYDLGVQLRMVTSDLDAIEQENTKDSKKCLRKMLSLWLTKTTPSPPSWQRVVDALCSRSIDRPALADKIRRTYCNVAAEQYQHSVTEDKRRKSLQLQVESLQTEFGKLKDDVYDSIKTEEVKSFRVKLASLDVNMQKHHETALRAIIGKKDTIEDVWIDLSFYMNFLNYELLQHVLNKFPNGALQDRMEQYTAKITEFFRNTLVREFVNSWPILGDPPPKVDLRKFIVKYNKSWETCTLEELDQLKHRLARKLLLPTFSLLLEVALESSVTLVLSVHFPLVAQLQADIKKTAVKEMADMEIESITVDGVVCYEAPLLQYTRDLKKKYTSMNPLQPLSDSKPHPLLPFRLARIEKQILSQSDMDRFTRESLRGDMDDVVYKKTAMELGELGVTGDRSRPQVVLVEGAPGVGKTMFAWDQCRQWAEGKLLQAYSIVLLLPLRDNNIRQISSLPDLFRHTKREVREEVSRRVAESGGKGCLIWLEAWDELPNHLRHSNSFFAELIRGLQLPAATIFITSRPWASRSLLETVGDRLSQHTELLALAKEEVENETRAMMVRIHSQTSSDSGFDFLQWIEANPMIHAAMYTPVTAAIVEQVMRWAPHNPPSTVTQLYSAYVLMRLEQHLSEDPNYRHKKMKVRSLADLPERVMGDLQRLCGLAYEGVSQQTIVFSSLPAGVSTLGLLQTVPQVYDEGEDQVSYNFLHYTVQEYLASLHLSHLPPHQLMTITNDKYLRMVKIGYDRFYYESTQFKTTFQFLAWITKLEPFPVDFLSDLLWKDAAIMYRWLYESQNQSLLTSVLGSGERQLWLSYSATATDYFAAGYCLAHSNCTWKIDLISVDDVAMEFLSKGCNHQIPETGISTQLVSADFRLGPITAEGVGHFLTIPNSLLQHIQRLNFYVNKLDRRGCELLAEGVQRMPSLETLGLSGNSDIGSGGAVQLMSSLDWSKLREMDMFGTGISDPDFECLARFIHSTTSLEVLRIGRNEISVESIGSLCRALSAKHSMRILDISYCHLTTSHCVFLGELLRQPIHCQIEKLDLTGCGLTSDGVGEVVRGLSDNHSLRVLVLRDNQIGSEGVVAMAAMLKTNSSLERLNLVRCGIGSSGGVELGAALERHKTLRDLVLSNNALGDDGVRGLSAGLENNSSLKELRLEDDKSLGEEGVSLLRNLERKRPDLMINSDLVGEIVCGRVFEFVIFVCVCVIINVYVFLCVCLFVHMYDLNIIQTGLVRLSVFVFVCVCMCICM